MELHPLSRSDFEISPQTPHSLTSFIKWSQQVRQGLTAASPKTSADSDPYVLGCMINTCSTALPLGFKNVWLFQCFLLTKPKQLVFSVLWRSINKHSVCTHSEGSAESCLIHVKPTVIILSTFIMRGHSWLTGKASDSRGSCRVIIAVMIFLETSDTLPAAIWESFSNECLLMF